MTKRARFAGYAQSPSGPFAMIALADEFWTPSKRECLVDCLAAPPRGALPLFWVDRSWRYSSRPKVGHAPTHSKPATIPMEDVERWEDDGGTVPDSAPTAPVPPLPSE